MSDYDDKETNTALPYYRSTLYWNPELITDGETGEKSISFFTDDLPGKADQAKAFRLSAALW